MLEPELLADVEPDIHLVTTLVSLARIIPTRTRQTARWVVRRFISHPFDGAQRVVQWNPCLNVPGMRNRSCTRIARPPATTLSSRWPACGLGGSWRYSSVRAGVDHR